MSGSDAKTARPAPRAARIPASRGVHWWRQAATWMFAPGQAGPWIAIGLAALLAVVIVGLLPRIGTLASTVVGFLLAAGMAVAARRSSRGEVPRLADLKAAVEDRATPLLVAAIALGVAAAFGADLLLSFGADMALGSMTGMAGDAGATASAGVGGLLAMLAGLAWLALVSMAGWLAAPLIVLGGHEPIAALRASVAATWRNGGAMIAYGLIFVALALVATALFGLGWLVLMPLVSLSSYAAYVDFFGGS